MQRQSDAPRRTGGWFLGACSALLAFVAALLMIPIGLIANPQHHNESWDADVVAVVEAVRPAEHHDGGYSAVRFAAPLPVEALDPTVTGDLVAEIPHDVQVGERVTCRVRQVYAMNTDLDSGSRTRIDRCWR